MHRAGEISTGVAWYSCERPTGEGEADARYGEKQPVVARHVCRQVAHVMKVQYVVVDEPFDHVECAPSQEQLPRERARRRERDAVPCIVQQQEDPEERDRPHGCVELAVPDHVPAHRLHGRRREHRRAHVVPLQNLVQHDAVDEPAHADADRDAGPRARGWSCCGGHQGGGPAGAATGCPPPPGGPPVGGRRGDGRLTRMAVTARTSAATASSFVDERRIAIAAPSPPSAGRWRRQFHAPSEKTMATSESFVSSVQPYGVVKSDESGVRCRYAVTSPESTRKDPLVSASGEKPFTMSDAMTPRRSRHRASRSSGTRPATTSRNSVPIHNPPTSRCTGLTRRVQSPDRIPVNEGRRIPIAASGQPHDARAAATSNPSRPTVLSSVCAPVMGSCVIRPTMVVCARSAFAGRRVANRIADTI